MTKRHPPDQDYPHGCCALASGCDLLESMTARLATADTARRYDARRDFEDRARERRKGSRIRVHDVFVLAGGAVRGRVLDLGAGGLSLLTARRIRPGEVLSFCITTDYKTAVSGTVCWSKLARIRAREDGGFEPLYQAGLALLHEPQTCKLRHHR